ncbi:MAG TPA: hypothetical protein DCM08_06675 [Microscillaceae bacterium]|jgi:hypothetical protein|nr:hypothetical protein [Microscillaceae bacterium]
MNFKYIAFLLPLILVAPGTPTVAQSTEKKAPWKLKQVKRVGAICKDGTRSLSTNSGACAGHKGVKQWLYAEAEVVAEHVDNVYEIPDDRLMPFSPEEVKDLTHPENLYVNLPPLMYRKVFPNATSDQEKTQQQQTDEKQTQQDKNQTYQQWSSRDFLMPFVLALAIVLLYQFLVKVINRIF